MARSGDTLRPLVDNARPPRCHRIMVPLAIPTRWLRRSAAGLLDLLLPPRCLACGATVGGNGELCSSCWRAITFLGAPCCACCGLPFAYDAGADPLCCACLAREPHCRR